MNECLPSKGRQKSNGNSNKHETEDQYSNLNVCQNHKSDNVNHIQANKKTKNCEEYDVSISDYNLKSRKLNVWEKPKVSSNRLNFKNAIEEKPDRYDKCANNTKNTLSLHIKAFEDSLVSVFSSDVSVKSVIKKEIMNNSTNNNTNPFELVRQQNDKVSEPEVSQFRASQKLLNPNVQQQHQAQLHTPNLHQPVNNLYIIMRLVAALNALKPESDTLKFSTTNIVISYQAEHNLIQMVLTNHIFQKVLNLHELITLHMIPLMDSASVQLISQEIHNRREIPWEEKMDINYFINHITFNNFSKHPRVLLILHESHAELDLMDTGGSEVGQEEHLNVSTKSPTQVITVDPDLAYFLIPLKTKSQENIEKVLIKSRSGKSVIGKSSFKSDTVITGVMVPNSHAQFKFTEDTVLLCDMASTNGTVIFDPIIDEEVWVSDDNNVPIKIGDHVMFGDSEGKGRPCVHCNKKVTDPYGHAHNVCNLWQVNNEYMVHIVLVNKLRDDKRERVSELAILTKLRQYFVMNNIPNPTTDFNGKKYSKLLYFIEMLDMDSFIAFVRSVAKHMEALDKQRKAEAIRRGSNAGGFVLRPWIQQFESMIGNVLQLEENVFKSFVLLAARQCYAGETDVVAHGYEHGGLLRATEHGDNLLKSFMLLIIQLKASMLTFTVQFDILLQYLEQPKEQLIKYFEDHPVVAFRYGFFGATPLEVKFLQTASTIVLNNEKMATNK